VVPLFDRGRSRPVALSIDNVRESAIELQPLGWDGWWEALADGLRPGSLWNAKMRFSKTFAAYHLAKQRCQTHPSLSPQGRRGDGGTDGQQGFEVGVLFALIDY